MFTVRHLFDLLDIAGVILALLSIFLAFRPARSPLLRFGPSATVVAYLVASAMYYTVYGVASLILVPTGVFGLFLGLRFLFLRSALGYSFAGLSFACWPAVIYVYGRFLYLVHFSS